MRTIFWDSFLVIIATIIMTSQDCLRYSGALALEHASNAMFFVLLPALCHESYKDRDLRRLELVNWDSKYSTLSAKQTNFHQTRPRFTVRLLQITATEHLSSCLVLPRHLGNILLLLPSAWSSLTAPRSEIVWSAFTTRSDSPSSAISKRHLYPEKERVSWGRIIGI